MNKTIKVGMADLNIAKTPDLLTTLGLGSCVGICLYDKITKVSGLAHIMLPSSKDIKNNTNKAKFADSGIDELINLMIKKGANNNNLLRIGERNVNATKEKLRELNIRIIAEDTGGNFGRTIVFDSSDGSLKIRTIGHGEKTI